MREPVELHPQPSIPNPLTFNPYAVLSDEDIDVEVKRAEARIDAIQHTLRGLQRERDRRKRASPSSDTDRSKE